MLRQLALPTLYAFWLALGFFIYGSTGHDDSHINFWNVHTLLTQGELVNYNGERVEQTTSLLQDFMTAALVFITNGSIVTTGYLVDIAAAFGCAVLATTIARQYAPALAAHTGTLLFSSASFLLWSFGGMGEPLTALCLLFGIFCWWRWLIYGKHIWQVLCATLALVLVRPEIPVVITAITAALVIACCRQQELRKRAWILFAVTLCATCALFAWQQWYFGSWLPLPAIAKQGGALSAQLQRGSYYMIFGIALNPITGLALLFSAPMLLIAAKSWWKKTQQPLDLLQAILLCSFFAYVGFIWTAGGDWMQASRFFVPIVPIATLLLLHILQKIPYLAVTHAIIFLLIAGQLFLQLPVITRQSHGIPVWVQTYIQQEHTARYGVFEKLNQEHVRDMAVIDHLAEIIPPLHQQLNRPLILMSGQAGMVFYYTAQQFYGQVIFRDLRGLVESSLTLCQELRALPRSPQGLFWGYRDFFEQQPSLQKTCGISKPDIIYDINDMTQKLSKTLAPYGYTLVHREGGFPVANATTLPYNRLLAPNLIFVRNDLLPLLSNPPLRVYNYKDLPLIYRWPLNHVW